MPRMVVLGASSNRHESSPRRRDFVKVREEGSRDRHAAVTSLAVCREAWSATTSSTPKEPGAFPEYAPPARAHQASAGQISPLLRLRVRGDGRSGVIGGLRDRGAAALAPRPPRT